MIMLPVDMSVQKEHESFGENRHVNMYETAEDEKVNPKVKHSMCIP